MAKSVGRFLMAFRLAALGGVALAAGPAPAAAEIPQTTAEWLAVFSDRQSRFDAVEIDSHWQRLEGEKVVEEWDQKFYFDDLGRVRLEELGRLQVSATRPGVGLLVDSTYAFDGAEYRELHARWEYSERFGGSPEALAKLRLSPPKVHQARLQAEANDFAYVRRTENPLRMCDHVFLSCLAGAAKAKTEPKSEPIPETPGLWLVTLDSQQDDAGRKCRAWVDAGQGNHVVRLDLWSDGDWGTRYETSYTPRDGHWLPARGERRKLRQRQRSPEAAAALRFVVLRAQLPAPRPDAGFLPALPLNTWVGDIRTGAGYQLGRDDHSETTVKRLVGRAREEVRAVDSSRATYFSWPYQARVIGLYAAAGAGLALLGGRLGTAFRRRVAGPWSRMWQRLWGRPGPPSNRPPRATARTKG